MCVVLRFVRGPSELRACLDLRTRLFRFLGALHRAQILGECSKTERPKSSLSVGVGSAEPLALELH